MNKREGFALQERHGMRGAGSKQDIDSDTEDQAPIESRRDDDIGREAQNARKMIERKRRNTPTHNVNFPLLIRIIGTISRDMYHSISDIREYDF